MIDRGEGGTWEEGAVVVGGEIEGGWQAVEVDDGDTTDDDDGYRDNYLVDDLKVWAWAAVYLGSVWSFLEWLNRAFDFRHEDFFDNQTLQNTHGALPSVWEH